MNITEKAAYLKGLADGLELDASAKETKLFKAVLDIIDDIALVVSDLDEEVAVMGDQLDAVDEDLDALEEYVFEDDDCCDCCGCDDDDDVYEVVCPSCGEKVYFDESIFDDDDDVTCPACGAIIEDLAIEDEDD